jgi:hypothetical protein
MKPCSYAHMIFDNGIQTCNGGNTASSVNVDGRTGYLPGEKLNKIYVFHPVQTSTQSGLRALI